MLLRLIFMLPLLGCFHGVHATPKSTTALDKAANMQEQMQRRTTDVFNQAEDLSQSEKWRNELDQAVSKFSKSESLPKNTLPDVKDLDTAQLSRARQSIQQLLNQAEQHQGLMNPELTKGPRLYIFVSFSMPDLTLQRLLKQARTINAPMVLRGLVKNDMNQTRIKLGQLLGANKQGKTTIKGGLVIDPTLYERFKISVVPSFVLTATPVSPCTQAGCPTPDYVRLAGNVSLDYALESLGQAAPAMRKYTDAQLATLRGKRP